MADEVNITIKVTDKGVGPELAKVKKVLEDFDQKVQTRNARSELQTLNRTASLVSREFGASLRLMGVTSALVGGGIVASIAGISRAVGDFARQSIDLHNAADQYGVSAKVLEQFRQAAIAAGAPAETALAQVQGAFHELQQLQWTGPNSPLAEGIRQQFGARAPEVLGEILEALAEGGPEKAFLKSVEMLERYAAENTDRGRQSVQILSGLLRLDPSFARGGFLAGLGAFANTTILSREAAQEYVRELVQLEKTVGEIGATLGIALVPGFLKLFTTLRTWLDSEAGKEFTDELAKIATSLESLPWDAIREGGLAALGAVGTEIKNLIFNTSYLMALERARQDLLKQQAEEHARSPLGRAYRERLRKQGMSDEEMRRRGLVIPNETDVPRPRRSLADLPEMAREHLRGMGYSDEELQARGRGERPPPRSGRPSGMDIEFNPFAPRQPSWSERFWGRPGRRGIIGNFLTGTPYVPPDAPGPQSRMQDTISGGGDNATLLGSGGEDRLQAVEEQRGTKDLTDQMKDSVDELRRLNELLRQPGGAGGVRTAALGPPGTAGGGIGGGGIGGRGGIGEGGGGGGDGVGGVGGLGGGVQWPSPGGGNIMPPGFGGGAGPGVGGGGWAGTIGGGTTAVPPGWGPGGSGQPWGTTGMGGAAGGAANMPTAGGGRFDVAGKQTWFLGKPWAWTDPTGKVWHDVGAQRLGEGPYASELPHGTPGFASPTQKGIPRGGLRGWYELTLPDGRKIVTQKVDIGPPGVIDLSAPLAHSVYGSQRAAEAAGNRRITGRYLGQNLPEGVTPNVPYTPGQQGAPQAPPMQPAPQPPPGVTGAGGVTHTGSGKMVPEALRQQMEYAGLVAGVRTEIAHGIEPGHKRHTLKAPSGDVDFFDPVTGQKLDVRNPADKAKMEAYAEAAARAGATGFGFGKGGSYMGFSRMHVGGGTEGVWGAGGAGPNAPDWLRAAVARGRASALTPEQRVTEIERLRSTQGGTGLAGKPVPYLMGQHGEGASEAAAGTSGEGAPRPSLMSVRQARMAQAQSDREGADDDANRAEIRRGFQARSEAQRVKASVDIDLSDKQSADEGKSPLKDIPLETDKQMQNTNARGVDPNPNTP